MNKGWFAIPGVQEGDRTLAEQLLGLAPALAEARGKRVLDLGSAEGLIAIEFARAGASVTGIEFNPPLYGVALTERDKLADPLRSRLEFICADLSDVAAGAPIACDVCLALAIVHKMPRPRAFLKWIAACTSSLVVVRLPTGSKGRFITKHHGAGCDVNVEMPALGFRLERTEQGPRTELVQYWRRCT